MKIIDSFCSKAFGLKKKIDKIELPSLDLDKVAYTETPNKSKRTDIIRGIVLHHTGPGSFNNIISWLTNPEAKASADYVIGYNGELKQLVKPKKASWHAGKSRAFLDGQERINLNNCTIGIEICNPGIIQKGDDNKYYYEVGRTTKEWKGEEPVLGFIKYPNGNILEGYYVKYTDAQISKLIQLCRALVLKYPQIERNDMLTHYQIAEPAGRKNDPFALNMEYIKDMVF